MKWTEQARIGDIDAAVYQIQMISNQKVNQKVLMQSKLIICRGLPASGKSTWAKQWVLEDPEHRVKINQDDIRLMLGKYWVPSREKLVQQEEALIEALLKGYDIVIDNTNLNKKCQIVPQLQLMEIMLQNLRIFLILLYLYVLNVIKTEIYKLQKELSEVFIIIIRINIL